MSEFDDWAFSKLDESLDTVVIPYVNKTKNAVSNFNPYSIPTYRSGTLHLMGGDKVLSAIWQAGRTHIENAEKNSQERP